MSVKFKYIRKNMIQSFIEWYEIDINTLKEGSLIENKVVCPKPEIIPNSCVRNGSYFIRSSKNKWTIYEHFNNIWICLEEEHIHNIYDLVYLDFFPQLSEREWELMKSIPSKRLTKEWKDNISLHDIWLNRRNIYRDTRKYMLKFKD